MNSLGLKKEMGYINLKTFKGIVHAKMKMTPWFTQAILGVYEFLLSDEYILS